jgi:hypothetical protein
VLTAELANAGRAWRGLVLPVLAGLAAMTGATARAGTGAPDDQLWTEVDLGVPLSERFTITAIAQLRLSESLPNPTQTASGFDLSYKDGDWTFAVGYRHQLTGDRIEENPNVTQIALGMATYAHRFGRNTIAVRVRLEDTITAASNPWRGRLRLEYRYATEGWGAISYLFVNDEGFFQFSDSSWFRNRAQAGGDLRLSKRADLKVYFQRQDSNNSKPGAINALGLLLAYNFD